MPTVHTEIDINAPIEKVWQVLTDFENYPSWHPTITNLKLDGEFKAGTPGQLYVIMKAGGQPSPVAVTLTDVEPQRCFGWVGGMGPAWLARGRHYHRLETLPGGGTRLIQGEDFTGLMFRLLWPVQGKMFVRMYEDVKNAIKQYCESQKS